MSARKVRVRVQIPEEDALPFVSHATSLGYTPAALLCHWQLVVVDALHQGRGDLLVAMEPIGRGERPVEYKWTQGRGERDRTDQVLAAAGWDRTLVCRNAVRRLNAADGRLERMEWLHLPPC